MTGRRLLATTAVVVALAGPAALQAQAVSLFVGGGGAFSLSHPGFDRSTGAAFLGGVEFAEPWRAGLAGRMGLRLQGGVANQNLAVSGGVVSGDVQTVHGAAALSVTLMRSGRFTSYALGGAVWARPSTRLDLAQSAGSTPGAQFEQITHETVPGALLGVGAGWRGRWATVRAEAQWISLSTAGGATRILPLVLTVAVPIHP